MTVLPGRDTLMPYATELSPPAQVLLPVPSVTVPAGTQLPIWLFAGSLTLALIPRST